MTNRAALQELAHKFQIKLAIDASKFKEPIAAGIKQALTNASTYSKITGIMSFPEMLEQDNATLSALFIRHKDDVSITNFMVSKPELAAKYQPLKDQFTIYLNKNLSLFPEMHMGETIDYNNFTFQLTFP